MNKVIIPLVMVLVAANLHAHEKSLAIGVNLLKPIMGLPNLELEYGHSKRLSLVVFSEYLVFRTPLSPPVGMHPDWVMRVGPRMYFHSFQGEQSCSGFYGGASLGFAWYNQERNSNPNTIGIEAGYKHLFFDIAYVQPRALLTHSMGTQAVTPGLELLLGAQL